MRSSRQHLGALCAATLLLTLVTPAQAGGAEEDAKTFFAQGRELRGAGKCADAIVAFRRALEIYPEGLGSLRNIAECEEQLALYASARRDWWDLRRAALQSNEAKYDGWDADAEARYRALADKVAKLTIKVSGDALDRVRVVMDGKPVDPRIFGVELERDPGAHTIEAFYGGATPISKKVDLVRGAREVVTLEIPPAETQAQPAKQREGATPTATSPSVTRTAGFIAIGVGGASAVATGVAIAVRASALTSIEEGCPAYETQPCPRTVEDDYETGKTASTLANVFGGVAIAGLGVGVTLLVIEASEGAGPGAGGGGGARLQIGPTRAGAAARLTGRF